MKLEEIVKTLRKEANLSQEELADKIGVSRQAITKWETGAGLPDVWNLKALADVFNVTVDFLLDGEIIPTDAEAVPTKKNIVLCYDVASVKDFDIEVGSCRNLSVKRSQNERVEVFTNAEQLVKVKIDENKSGIDVDFVSADGVSDMQRKSMVDIEIFLPKSDIHSLEISTIADKLSVAGLTAESIELGGKFHAVELDANSAHVEIDCPIDMDIDVLSLNGRLDVNQWKATSTVRLHSQQEFALSKHGIKNSITLSEKAKKLAVDYTGQEQNVISQNGYRSELSIKMSGE